MPFFFICRHSSLSNSSAPGPPDGTEPQQTFDSFGVLQPDWHHPKHALFICWCRFSAAGLICVGGIRTPADPDSCRIAQQLGEDPSRLCLASMLPCYHYSDLITVTRHGCSSAYPCPGLPGPVLHRFHVFLTSSISHPQATCVLSTWPAPGIEVASSCRFPRRIHPLGRVVAAAPDVCASLLGAFIGPVDGVPFLGTGIPEGADIRPRCPAGAP